MKRISLLCFFIFLLAGSLVNAEPFVPDSAHYIVTESNVKSQEKYYSNFRQLKEFHLLNPNDIESAISIANAYLLIARKTGDSRYFGLAEQAIKPWWSITSKQRLSLIKAFILQFSHRFEESTAILDDVLKLNPRNAQALLLRANNLMSTGELTLATKDCVSLSLISSPSISAACFVAVKGLQVDSEAMLSLVSRLQDLVSIEKGLDEEILLWINAIIVELLTVHGQLEMAELTMEQLKSHESFNQELILLNAEVLLRLGKNSKVIQLLEQKTSIVDAQLKFLMAKKQQSGYLSDEYKELEKRFENDAFRGEMHFRERAIFEFSINENYSKAFEFAVKNWHYQRTMKDASLLYRCAEKINNVEAMNQIQQWRLLNNIKVEFAHNIL